MDASIATNKGKGRNALPEPFNSVLLTTTVTIGMVWASIATMNRNWGRPPSSRQ